MTILSSIEEQLISKNTAIEIQILLKQSHALSYGHSQYWNSVLEFVKDGSFSQID